MRLSKHDRDLVRDYTRVRLQLRAGVKRTARDAYEIEADVAAFVLEVGTLEWRPRHCMPLRDWLEVERLPRDASARAIAGARRKLLEDERYFVRCDRCGIRWPRNWSPTGVCSCASTK